MPTKDLQRWEHDGAAMKTQLEQAGYKVKLKFAENVFYEQIEQVSDMIDSGSKVIIIAAIEGYSLRDVVDEAGEKGVKVIAYDRMLLGTDKVSYYTTFDNYKVGKLQGNYIRDKLKLDSTTGPYTIEFTGGDAGDMNAEKFYQGALDVLKPYLDSGVLVCKSGQTSFTQAATLYWRTETARKRAEKIINEYYSKGKTIDAWMCSNDSTALGVINALDDNYTGNKWPIVTGQDCDRVNVKLMIAGKQAMSVFKVTDTLVSRTVKIVRQILNHEKVDTNATTDNGSISVPTYLCSPVTVDKSNYRKYLIDSGYYTDEDLQ